ncbi:MAG: VOC family protein [Xanthomonadales bacterium]|nr:VOC family protein [Xanthomonadales bacterium]
MHKSQLAGFIIDCETDDLEAAALFWSSALGIKARGPDGPAYVALDTRPEDYHLEVQKVSHPSRVHLDIEADDIEAEAKRLEALGARRIGAVGSRVVMEAPTGQRFCVVRPQRANFENTANTRD